MAENTMDIVVEDDGTISIQVDKISPMSHKSAEDFLRMCRELAGGEVKTIKHPHSHGVQKNQVKAER